MEKIEKLEKLANEIGYELFAYTINEWGLTDCLHFTKKSEVYGKENLIIDIENDEVYKFIWPELENEELQEEKIASLNIQEINLVNEILNYLEVKTYRR